MTDSGGLEVAVYSSIVAWIHETCFRIMGFSFTPA